MARATILAALALAAGLLGPTKPASAQQLQVFPDRAALVNASNGPLAGASFEDLPEFSFYTTLPYEGLTLHSIDPVNPSLAVFGPATFPQLPSNTLVSMDATGPEPGPVVLEFAPAVTAVGLEVCSFYFDGSVSPAGSSVLVTVEGTDGAQSQVLNLNPDGSTFLGLGAVTGSISRITISNLAGQTRFVAVDDVAYGELAAGIGPILDQMSQVIADARANGLIWRLGTSLEGKLEEIKSDLAQEDLEDVKEGLQSLRNEICAQRGKKIAPAVADQLNALIQDALALIPADADRDCDRGHNHRGDDDRDHHGDDRDHHDNDRDHHDNDRGHQDDDHGHRGR
jgi:hypothetical protein